MDDLLGFPTLDPSISEGALKALYCTEPFLFALPLAWYDWKTVEKGEKTQTVRRCLCRLDGYLCHLRIFFILISPPKKFFFLNARFYSIWFGSTYFAFLGMVVMIVLFYNNRVRRSQVPQRKENIYTLVPSLPLCCQHHTVLSQVCWSLFQPQHEKTFLLMYVTSLDTNQPAQPKEFHRDLG